MHSCSDPKLRRRNNIAKPSIRVGMLDHRPEYRGLPNDRSQAPDGSPEFELVVRRHPPYILGPLNRFRAVHYHTRKDYLHTMAILSEDHIGHVPDSKMDTKIEDEQVEHGSPDAAQFIETKYAGESGAGIFSTMLILLEIWADGELQRSFGGPCYSAAFSYGPV